MTAQPTTSETTDGTTMAAPASASAAGMVPKRMTLTRPVKEPSDRLRPYILWGLGLCFLLVGGIGGWAATTNLAGAVLGPGVVVVDSNVKKVQHPTGGIVGEIRVKDGDRVKTGDLVLRLDETLTRANLLVISKQLDELAVRGARLKAERDGLEDFDLPVSHRERAGDPAIQELMAGERSLFLSRKQTRAGQKAQLRERISQLREEIQGLVSQRAAKAKEIELIGKELVGLEELEAKQLVTTNRMTALRRETARLEGEQAQLQAAAAQAKGKVAEIELQILQLDQEGKTEVIKELRDIQAKDAEFQERRVAAEDQLKRVELRAPQSGTVHQLNVHTVGGVINASEPVMLIVPEGDRLVIETRIAPQDRDQVRVGQPASIRFSAFNQRTTPEFKGVLARVSPDLTREQQTGLAYYVARVEIPDEELKRMGDLKLVPGMPADVQIKTEDRTALSYFLKPLEDQISKAFKER